MQQVYTAYDTSGQNKLTDTDQIMEQRRREMADQAFRSALQSNQNNMQREGWGREDARFNQNMSAQERIAAASIESKEEVATADREADFAKEAIKPPPQPKQPTPFPPQGNKG